MKNKLYTAIMAMSFVGGSMLTSCGDSLLDTKSPSSMDDTNIFTIYDLAVGTINSIYTYYGEQNYRARFLPWYGMNTDIEWYNSSDNARDQAYMANYNTLPTNGQMNISNGNEPWSNIYKGIEKANLAIQGLSTYADLTDSGMAQLYGEALTLRAMAYVDLINAWGDVPARFEPITPETIYKTREDRDVIYKQIIADLQEAQNMVAWPTTTTTTATVERINRAFVKGLLARVCMQASGYALRSDGTVRQSTDPELSKDVLYPIALQACVDVMEQEGRYVALESDFETIFRKNCQDNITAGGESLWEIPYANSPTARGRQVYTFGTRHLSANQFVEVAQGGQVGPTPQTFFDYSISDKRRDVTCIPYRWNTADATTKQSAQVLSSLNSWCFGKLRYEWMNRKINGSDDGINKIYMRYADIVLMRAELENELNGPSAAAPYLRQIRQRAFDPADWTIEVEQYIMNVSTNRITMFNAIVDERAFEFCGEMIRKADLIRWNLLKSKLDEAKAKMYRLRALEGEYSDLNPYLYYNLVNYNQGSDGVVYEAAALQIYGLNHGETQENPDGYEFISQNSEGSSSRWFSESNLNDTKIETIYLRDPDRYMYWPIFEYNINDNPLLENYSWFN